MINIVAVLFPDLTQLDLTGPAQVFAKYPDAQLHLVWNTLSPVVTDGGWCIVPTTTFQTCVQADVLFVPGGDGAFDVMDDPLLLAFLREQAERADWVTSVCTGSFVLAAAGLLTGYRATSHWASLDMLSEFGVIPVSERVVRDRNRITGAGVTSGIDFAFTLAAQLFGDDEARRIQLALEYDPDPPFEAGSPAKSDPELVRRIATATQGRRIDRVRRAAAALGR